MVKTNVTSNMLHVASDSDILYEVMQATMTMKTIFDGVTSFVIWLYYDVGICINHISWIVWRVFDFQLRGTNLKILYCLTYTIHFYSTITIFWQGIRKYDVVDIFGIVYEMRKERVWMVQTEQQYICIHQVSIKLKITNKAPPTISLYGSSLIWLLLFTCLYHDNAIVKLRQGWARDGH